MATLDNWTATLVCKLKLAVLCRHGEEHEHVFVLVAGECQVQGFRVEGSGLRDQGSGFRVQGSGFRVQGSGFRVQGAGFRVQGSGVQVSGFRV